MAAPRALTKAYFDNAMLNTSAEIANMHDEIMEIKKIVKGDGNGNPSQGERIRDNAAEIEKNKHEIKEIKEFIKEMRPLLPIMRGIMFLGSAFGITLIAFIWGIVTHQISVSFSP